MTATMSIVARGTTARSRSRVDCFKNVSVGVDKIHNFRNVFGNENQIIICLIDIDSIELRFVEAVLLEQVVKKVQGF